MTTDKVIDRIKKLLSLASSANEHEAASAMAKATELMVQHQISEASVSLADEPEQVEEQVLFESGRRVVWKGAIAEALTYAAGCKSYTLIGGGKSSLRLIGTPSALATVRYMFAYLVKEIERISKRSFIASGQVGRSRAWQNAFKIGATSVICKRIKMQRKETIAAAAAAGQNDALVVVKQGEKDVSVFMAREVGATKKSSRPSMSSSAGYTSGRDAGSKVNLGGNMGLNAGSKQLA